jgi:UDPglucose 6-dehydrogenase
MENAAAQWPTLTYATSIEDAVADADLLIVATEWSEFRAADPEVLGSVVAHRRVIDGRNCLPADTWMAAGWTYLGMGRHAG